MFSLTACPKSNEAVDAGAPAPSVSVNPVASQVTLAPLDETATSPLDSAPLPAVTHAASTATVKPAATATASSAKPATPSAQAQLRQCCSAIRKQAQHDPSQGMQLQQAATICDGLVAAMADAPTMPQLDGVKAMLAGAQLPPVCQGL
ncbi:MAG TPA: hypothetical protein VGH28_22660 [Polyangiaceae bacterium]